ncbi:MAG: S41 family peptidase [Verrucomicrobiota bacterium]
MISFRVSPLVPAFFLFVFTALAGWSADDPEYTETLTLLKAHLVDPNLVKPSELKTQTASALLQQVGFGSLLMTHPSVEDNAPTPIRMEVLQPYKIGYIRMPSFKPAKDWNALYSSLVDWQKNGVFGLILDLRDFEGSSDFAGAAHAASLFCAPNTVLFSTQGLQTPQQIYSGNRASPLSIRPLVIIINRRTVGAAEAFASAARQSMGAILVGRSTAGQAAIYTDLPLRSGKFVRIPTSTAQLPDGTRLFGKPVQPDLPLFTEDLSERQAIAEGQLSGSTTTVRELPTRQRISEAALVKQDNPEFDEVAADQKKKKKGDAKSDGELIQDVTLIRAVDVVRGIQLHLKMTGR